MAVEIEFSLITQPSSFQVIEKALEAFTIQTGIKVRVTTQNWNTAWSELVKFSIYRSGADVSEVGTTWMGDLVEMNNVRPFSNAEINTMGGMEAFLKASWSTSTSAQGEIFAIPWLADSRFIYYREDLLTERGIDPESLRTHAGLVGALNQLKETGVEIPIVLPTHRTHMTLHNVASWVWGNGGHFFSSDGKKVIFNQDSSIEGFRQYFELGTYIPKEFQELDDVQSDALFATGRAAVTISGPWVVKSWISQPDVVQKVRALPLLHSPFIGGSNLVIWNHTRRPRESVALVQYLTSTDFQRTYLPDFGLMPVRLDVLNNPPYKNDPIFHRLSEGLQTGRSFRLSRLWGLVEDRLSNSLSSIWSTLHATQDPNIEKIIRRELDGLANRLNVTLGER